MLQRFKAKTVKPQVFVGCAKWGRKEWVGRIYPEGTKDKEFLQNYVDHFNAIELNATHYRLQKSEVIQGWKEKAKPGFHFCPKFHQKITHIHRLKEAEDWTDAFLNSVGGLGENLGVCFLQLPPQLHCQIPRSSSGVFGILAQGNSCFGGITASRVVRRFDGI